MAEKLPQAVLDAQGAGASVLELTGDNEEVYYFRKPGSKDIERYIATATKGKPVQAVRNLVLEMALHPTAAELQKEFVEKPGRMVALNSALQGSVGMNEDFAAKKL